MKLTEIEEWFEDLRNIIVDLNISLNNAKYLLTSENTLDKGTEQKIKQHGFFKHHTYQLKFIIVIQLSKIFDNNQNQKRNIFKLFNRLENESFDKKFNERLNENAGRFNCVENRKQLLQRIKILRNEINHELDFLKDLKNARDKLYAHKDPKKRIEFLKWPDLERLIKLSSKIYNQTYGGIFGSQMEFTWTGDWNVKDIIRNYAIFKDIVNKNRIARARQKI